MGGVKYKWIGHEGQIEGDLFSNIEWCVGVGGGGGGREGGHSPHDWLHTHVHKRH